MRPLLIRMQGFGPFRDETVVDFADVELVGLVGSTGSGKSTILDAITFALFGRIARLDARLVAPVVNALSQEARVSFDFELDGTTYTAIRVVRRTGTGASTKEARLESRGETLAASKDELDEAVEQLLGMNFDRFTKVVFLPQGKFSAFLHDRPADRQKLLRVLLGLGIYERIGKRAREISRTATDQLEVLRPKLNDAGVSDEQIAALADAAATLRATHDNLRARLNERQAMATELADLERQADDFAVLVLAVAGVRVPDEVRELGDRITSARQQLVEAQAQATSATASYAAASTAVTEGPDKAACERLAAAHVEADALDASLGELDDRASAAAERQRVADDAVAEVEREIAAAEQATTAAETAARKMAVALADGRPLAEIDKDLATHLTLAELTARLETLQATAAAAAVHAEATAVDLVEAQRASDAAAGELRQIEIASHAEVLVGALAVGDECPVCRQVVNDVPEHEPSHELDAAERAVTEADRVLARARLADAEAGRAAAVATAQAAEAETSLARQAELISPLPSMSALEAERAGRAQLEADHQQAQSDAEAARRHERSLRESDRVRATHAAANQAATDIARVQAELQSVTKRRAAVAELLAGAPGRSEIEAQLAVVEQLLDAQRTALAGQTQAASAVEAARLELARVEAEQDEWRGRFSELRDGFVGIGPPQPAHASILADWQAFADWAASQRAPLESHHEAARAAAAAATTALEAADDAIRELCASIPEAGDVAIVELDALVTRVVAAADADLTNARRRQDQLAKARAEVEHLEEVEAVHDVLGNQLRSSGFEQWLLDEVIESLVERASERLFELSSGQYSIEVDGMVFEVRDHRNGDELRDARTLSGGETFLASLALALALADSIGEMAPTEAPAIECLFLDEGFGTLDPETLDVVAAAIEELGAAGRMVGVITHIRDLAERMPVRFEVTKQATTSVVDKVFS